MHIQIGNFKQVNLWSYDQNIILKVENYFKSEQTYQLFQKKPQLFQ